jgi:hypothetical protein
MRISKYTKEIIEETVKNNTSLAGVLKSMGLKLTGGNYTYFQKLIRSYEIDTSHFLGKGWAKGETQHTHPGIKKMVEAISHSEEIILSANAPPTVNTYHLVKTLISKGIEYKCSNVCCGISEWYGEPITLHVDHKNGINNDNRLENLRFLCPNCHQQTETWGKHKKRAA